MPLRSIFFNNFFFGKFLGKSQKHFYMTSALVYYDWVGHIPSLGYDLLDGHIKSVHANFWLSALLSNKVLIFSKKCHISTAVAFSTYTQMYIRTISKEICDSFTYIACSSFWRGLIFSINPTTWWKNEIIYCTFQFAFFGLFICKTMIKIQF